MPDVHAPGRRPAPGRKAPSLSATPRPARGGAACGVAGPLRPHACQAAFLTGVGREAGRQCPRHGHGHQRGPSVQPLRLGPRSRHHRVDVLTTSPEIARQTILTLRAAGRAPAAALREEPGRSTTSARDLVSWDGPLHLKAIFGFALSPLWAAPARATQRISPQTPRRCTSC